MAAFPKPLTEGATVLKNLKDPKVLRMVGAALVIAVVVALSALWQAKAERYQAVFLDNNQVYFGKLKYGWAKTARLSDVFYLRVTQAIQPQGGEPQPDLQLVQLGGEIHGPQQTMFIPKSQILFWENLRTDSQVVRAIENFKVQNKK